MGIDPAVLLNELPDLVCCFTPDGTLRYVNQAYADYYATEPEALIGMSFLDLVPVELRPTVAENLARLASLSPEQRELVDIHQGGDAEGSARWMQWTNRARFLPDSDEPIEFVGVGRDITDQKHTQDRVRFLADHDPLTGAVNWSTLHQELAKVIEDHHASGQPFGLVYLDLDGLKAINDRSGHSAGDFLLKLTAQVLTSSFRSTDLVARMGGDEFVVLCPGLDSSDLLVALLGRARANFAYRWRKAGWPGEVGISAGCVDYDGNATADQILQAADAAMYADKRSRKAAAGIPTD